jgi:tripartite-type tricarboxylate transporter receptor subunit TctC
MTAVSDKKAGGKASSRELGHPHGTSTVNEANEEKAMNWMCPPIGLAKASRRNPGGGTFSVGPVDGPARSVGPRRRFKYVVAALTVTLSAHGAWCQTSRLMNIIVPFNAGGPQDTVARLLADQVGRTQGRTIVIENRPGASTAIGTEAVSRAAPDGNSLLINGPVLLVTPHVRKVNYDPVISFEPVCYLVRFPTVILTNNASPYRTLADLLDAARAKPGDLTFAGFGPATPDQIAFETFKRATNVNMSFVPYPGYVPALNALLGGHVSSVLADYSASAQQIAAGKLRALVTLSRTRIDALPDVPTMAELGYKEIEYEPWSGLFAPAKTPKETVFQLASWFTAAIQAPEVRARLVSQGFYPVGMCGANFSAIIRKQNDEYGRAMRELNFKLE